MPAPINIPIPAPQVRTLYDVLTQKRAERATQGLQAAQTGLMQQQAKLLPLEDIIKATQTAQIGTRFGPAYQQARALMAAPKQSRDLWIANHQAEWNNIMDSLGNQALQQPMSGGLLQQAMEDAFPQYMSPQNTIAPHISTKNASDMSPDEQIQHVKNAIASVDAGSPDQFTETPADNEHAQLVNQYASNRDTISPKMRSQQDFSVRAERFLHDNQPEMAKRINDILDYTGAIGRGKKYFQMWANQNPDKVSSYDWYKNSFATGLSNIIRQIEGMGATDQQKRELLELVNDVDNITSNPTRAKLSINKMVNTLDELAQANFQASEPNFQDVTRKLYNLPRFYGDYLSMEEPEETKKAEDKSTQALLQELINIRKGGQ